MESHNRSYWDQLVYSLKDSIAEDVVKLQNFIDPSTAALTKQPVSLEEIGESGFNYSNITETHQEVTGAFYPRVVLLPNIFRWKQLSSKCSIKHRPWPVGPENKLTQ